MALDKVKVVLNNWASMYAENVRKELVNSEFVNTGRLLKSVGYELKEDGDIMTFNIKSDNYLGIINQGIPKGKNVNQNKLIAWIKSKGIQPLMRTKSGKFKKVNEKSYRQLAFVMSRSMKNNGVVKRFNYGGSHLLERFQDRLQAEFTPQLIEAMGLEIQEQVKRDINGKS